MKLAYEEVFVGALLNACPLHAEKSFSLASLKNILAENHLFFCHGKVHILILFELQSIKSSFVILRISTDPRRMSHKTNPAK